MHFQASEETIHFQYKDKKKIPQSNGQYKRSYILIKKYVRR